MNIVKIHTQSIIKLITLMVIGSSLIACQGQPSAETLNDQQYTVLSEPITTSSGDKIEVVELFWYGCGHCYQLEPAVDNWKKKHA